MNEPSSGIGTGELEALVKRVGSTKAPDRELDEAVWRLFAREPGNEGDAPITGSIDAAVKLAESLLPGWQWKLQRSLKGGAFYKFTVQPPDGVAIRGYSENVASLAVVDGLLRALLEHPQQ